MPRSRPFITDWTDDGLPDLLVGAGDGKIHLFQGIPEPASLSLLAIAGVVLLWSQRYWRAFSSDLLWPPSVPSPWR